MQGENNTKKRFDIDCSARFYPIMSTKRAQSLFRISAIMCDEVDREVLESALNDVLLRFNAYRVRLKRGYAWHFFEQNDMPARVLDEVALLTPINPDDTNGYLFRVCAVRNEIILEIFHALCDGNGALAFLRSIVQRYRQLLGFNVLDEGVIDWQSAAHDDESEDGFEKNYQPIPFSQMKLGALAGKVPHRIDGTLKKDGYAVSEAVCESADIIKRAKEIGVSFTAYLTGVLGVAIESVSKSKRPLAIMVPVNLRALYPTKSMRNFVTFARVILSKKECESIEKCALEAQKQLKLLTAKNKLDAFISTTVRAQKSWILKLAPLALKTALIRLGRLLMRSRQTIIFSNLGNIVCGEETGVKRFALNMNVSRSNTQNLGAITTNGKANLAFTRAIEETVLPDKFFALLAEEGIATRLVR